MKLQNAITDIPGIRVGHAQNQEALTGCTVVLCEGGAVGGVDQRGGAPGTRETDALHPMHLVEQVHGVVLSGGSAFGLDAASGAVQYLEEKGIGFDVGVARVPIVPSAILFDLAVGRADIRPDAKMGYQACQNASTEAPQQGNFGAGAGATVGKVLGMHQSMKAGIGSASVELGSGILVGALMAVNAFGDIIDPNSNQIIAGARSITDRNHQDGTGPYFADSMEIIKPLAGNNILGFAGQGNTIIGIVATNADLNKEQTNKVAQMAQDGIARTVRPAHTMLDGDTIFALATGERAADVNIVGAYAADVVAQAIINAVFAAKPAAGLPGAGSQRSTD